MSEITATEEAIIALYKDSQLVAIIKKNGKIEHFKTEEMNFGDFEELYEVRGSVLKV